MDVIQTYRQSELTGDSSVHLVVLLYDQLLRDLRSALHALIRQDIARRCQEMDHAFLVLAELQCTLNSKAGGEVAQTLSRFYDEVRSQLLRASVERSPELLEQQLQNILGVREAWVEVERQQAAASSAAQRIPDAQPDQPKPGGSKWSA